MRYYPTPEIVQFGDLRHGFDKFVEKNTRSHLIPILSVLNQFPSRPNAEIITWRGVLTRILGTSFDHRTDWSMVGCLRNGILFIEEERLVKVQSGKEKMATYWGHKFENLCLVPHDLPPHEVQSLSVRRETPVNANSEFDIVVKTKLGKYRFVIGAEIDGVDESGKEYIELKTTKQIRNAWDQSIYNDKLMKYWLQSYLAGVPKIIVGVRDPKGRLRNFETIETSQIPRTVRGRVAWDPAAILLMGEMFFDWLYEQLNRDKPADGGDLVFHISHSAEDGGVIKYDTDYGIEPVLPEWYKYYKDPS